jgi:hypothetical protein
LLLVTSVHQTIILDYRYMADMSGGFPVPGVVKLPIDVKADVKVRCKALRGPG